MILADDLGYADVSSFGSTDLNTPNVDRLAAEGMKLTRFYANCCVCSPTRASLLTGRYPELVGVPGVIRTHAQNSWGRLDSAALLLRAVAGSRPPIGERRVTVSSVTPSAACDRRSVCGQRSRVLPRPLPCGRCQLGDAERDELKNAGPVATAAGLWLRDARSPY